MQIEYRDLDSLVSYEANTRTHSDEQIAQIAASIGEFGFTNPLLIDGDNRIIAGHGRAKAAHSCKLNAVPCIVLDHLSDDQIRALVVADNQLALNAGWNEDLLTIELQSLAAVGFNVGLIGFDAADLDKYLAVDDPISPGLVDEDDAPAVQSQTVSGRADLWLLGGHRVMCGDSTDTSDVAALMGGGMSDLIFTDPPYGMSYNSKSHGVIKGDGLRGDALRQMVADSIGNAVTHRKNDAAAYICFTWRTYTEFLAAITAADLKPKACIVWDKKWIGMGALNYRPQHEFIFYAVSSHALPVAELSTVAPPLGLGGNNYLPQHEFIFYCQGQWMGDKAQSDVWSMSRDAATNYVHPTQKPVELIEKAIKNSSKQGDIVHDCFGGSGSTLIACERLGRFARLMELDGKYCDVIIRRWQNYTTEKAIRESDGLTFDLVAAGG